MTSIVGRRFRLRLLGPPSLTAEDGTVPPSLGWGKPLALLSLLAVRRDLRREEVVDLLWRDVEEAKARNAFRQALHRLRTPLGDELIPQDRDRLRLAASERLDIDADRFDRALAAGRAEDAVEIYAGDFLEGAELGEAAFDLWAEQERTRLQARFHQALRDSIAIASAAGKSVDAVARSRRLLAVAPFDSAAAHLAATTLISAGRRVEAQELIRQFSMRLQSELGLAMPSELQALATRIERHAPPTPAPAVKTPGAEWSLPFVGREAELSQALALWRTTSEDAGALVLIEGEAGAGKTRLVCELATTARSLGPAIALTARERASGVPLPYGLFAEALKPLVRAKGVAGASRHLLAEAARLLPELRDTFELPPLSDVEDEASRVRFFEGVAALVDAAAYENPLLVVLEDLQSIAPSSLDLLSYLAARLAGSGVMFLLTVRPDDAPLGTITRIRALAEGSASGEPPHGRRARRIALAPLARRAVFDAVDSVAAVLQLDPGRAERVAQRAEGIPGRLMELLRHAADGDDPAVLPIRLHELVADRLRQLSSAQRRMLLVIAMLERPADPQLLADAAHLSSGATAECLAQLERAGFVMRMDGGVAAVEPAASVAIEAGGPASRRFLAAWIADALARDPAASSVELGRFYALAGLARPAFDNARRAAYQAVAIGAIAEAVQLLGWARTFASTAEEHAEVESLLSALGSGRRRLAPVATADPTGAIGAAPALHGAAMSDSDAAPTRSTSPPGPTRLETLFPNWRVLLGAAIATLVLTAVTLAARDRAAGAPAVTNADTLVLADEESDRGLRYVTGDMQNGFVVSGRMSRPASDPPWLDSLARPWTNPLAAPGGRGVAIARVTATGSDVYVISTDRRDTTALVRDAGDSRPLSWSPDGRWLVVGTSGSTSRDRRAAGLRAYRLVGAPSMVVIDTVPGHTIAEALWSPDGSRIAWVARVGADRQLEVFTSQVDGSGVVNVSRHPADDQHIGWSADGDLLSFTSMRDGNAELYAMDIRGNRLWRLTRDPAQDDNAAFSRDGRLVAFESTRGGTAATYVMPGLGGDAVRVGSGPLSVVRWRGGPERHVSRARVDVRVVASVNDTTRARLLAFDQFGEAIATRDVRWSVLDTALARLGDAGPAGTGDDVLLRTRRAGLARVVGSVGRWRADTAFLRIGTDSLTVLAPVAADAFRAWRPLGSPSPKSVAGGGIIIAADRQWDSGVLSRPSLPLAPGLAFSATLEAPFRSAGDAATSVTMALVAPEDESSIPMDAPQFLRYAALQWNAEADRLLYSVGREVFSESVGAVAAEGSIRVEIVVREDSTVAFVVGGRERWRSSLRVVAGRNEARAQLWIGGRATGNEVRVSAIGAVLRPVRQLSP